MCLIDCTENCKNYKVNDGKLGEKHSDTLPAVRTVWYLIKETDSAQLSHLHTHLQSLDVRLRLTSVLLYNI